MRKSLLHILLFILLNSCSPLSTLVIQNNTDKPVEVYVELKDKNYTKKAREIFENRDVYNFKSIDDFDKIISEKPFRYYLQANKVSGKKYVFTSNLDYNFRLESNSLSIVDPSNSISIYPFKKVYYIKNDKKCFVIPKSDNIDCNFKVINKTIFKKNGKVKRITDFIELNR